MPSLSKNAARDSAVWYSFSPVRTATGMRESSVRGGVVPPKTAELRAVEQRWRSMCATMRLVPWTWGTKGCSAGL